MCRARGGNLRRRVEGEGREVSRSKSRQRLDIIEGKIVWLRPGANSLACMNSYGAATLMLPFELSICGKVSGESEKGLYHSNSNTQYGKRILDSLLSYLDFAIQSVPIQDPALMSIPYFNNGGGSPTNTEGQAIDITNVVLYSVSYFCDRQDRFLFPAQHGALSQIQLLMSIMILPFPFPVLACALALPLNLILVNTQSL